MRCELHIDLDTYIVDSHVPRAKNAIKFLNKRLRSIQCKTQFNKYFGNANNITLAQNDYFEGVSNNNGNNDVNNNNGNKNQNHGRNNHNQILEDDTIANTSYNDYDVYDVNSKDNHQGDHNPEDRKHEDHNVGEPGGNGQDASDTEQDEEDTGPSRRRDRRSMHQAPSNANSREGLKLSLVGIEWVLIYALY